MSQILRPSDSLTAIGTLSSIPKAVEATSALKEPEPVVVKPPQPVKSSLPAAVSQAQLEAAIAVNRANTPDSALDQRSAPRYSIREFNTLSPEEVQSRLSKISASDDRPGWVKALDLIDMPRNFIHNVVTEEFVPEAKRMALKRGEFDQAGQVKVYGSDILRAMGVKNQVVNAVGGFFVDVFTDPLSFIGGPLGGLKTVGTRGAAQVSVKGRRTLNSSINALRQGKFIGDGDAKRALDAVVRDGFASGALKQGADNNTIAAYARDALLGTSGKIADATERIGLGKFTKGGYLADDVYKVAKDTNGQLRAGYTATEAARIDAVKDFVAANSNNGVLNFSKGKGGAEILHVPFMPSTTVTIPSFKIPGTKARFGRQAELQIASAAVRKGNPAQAQAVLDAIGHSQKVRNLTASLEETTNQLKYGVEDQGPAAYEALKATQADLTKKLRTVMDEGKALRDSQLGRNLDEARGVVDDLPTLFATMDLYDEASIAGRHAEKLSRWVDVQDNVFRATKADINAAQNSRKLLEEAAQAQFKMDPEKFTEHLLDPAKRAEGFDDLVEAHIAHAGLRYRELITASADDLKQLETIADAYSEHVDSAHQIAKMYNTSIRGALHSDAALLADASAMMLRVSDPDLGHLPGSSFAKVAETLGMTGLSSRISNVGARAAVNLGGVKGTVPDIMRHVRGKFSGAKHAAGEVAHQFRRGLEDAIEKSAIARTENYDTIAELAGLRLEQKMIERAHEALDGRSIRIADELFEATGPSRKTLEEAMSKGLLRDAELLGRIDEMVDEAAELLTKIGDEAVRRGDFDNPIVAYMPVMLKREASRRANIARGRSGSRGAAEALLEEAGGPMTFDPTKRRITNMVRFVDNEGNDHAFTIAEGAAYAGAKPSVIDSMPPAEAKNARRVQEGVDAFRAKFGTKATGDGLVEAMQARSRPMLPSELNAYAENGHLDAIVGGVIGSGSNRREFFETNMVNLIYNRVAAHETLRVKEGLRDIVDEFVVARIDVNDIKKTTAGETTMLSTGEEAKFLGDGRIRVGNRDYVQLAAIQSKFAPESIFDPVRILGDNAEEMFIPDTLATEMLRLSDTLKPEPMGEIMQMAERVTSLFRTTTLMHPSWAVTNSIGNTVLAAMGGAMSDPKRAAKFGKYLTIAARAHFRRNADETSRLRFLGRGANRAGTAFGDNLDKTHMIAGGPVSMRQVLRLADDGQVTGSGRAADVMDAMIAQHSRDLPGLADDISGAGFLQTAQRLTDRRRAGRVSGKLANAVDVPYGIAAAAPTDLYRRTVSTWFQANATIDDVFRTAFFMQALDDGLDPITAAAKTRRHMLNFGDLSSFERNTLRPLIPFYCVPDSYTALTRSGWKTCDEIDENEEMLTYNSETDRLEWQPCEGIAIFEHDQDLLALKSRGKEVLCTDHHRWITETRYTKTRGEKYANEINKQTRVIVSAELGDSPDSMGVEASRLLGWIVTDGYHRWRGNHLEAVVYQSPKKYLDVVKSIAGGRPRKPHPESGVVCVPVLQERLTPDIRRVLKDEKSNLVAAVAAMSKPEADAFYEAAVLAEGSVAKGVQAIAAQKDHVRDAIRVAAFLTGHGSCTMTSNGQNKGLYVGKKAQRRRLAYAGVEKKHYKGRVWCPKTQNGTWVMFTGDQVMVTGNTWMRASLPSFVARGIKDPKLLSAVPKIQVGLEELLAGEDRLPRHMRPRWLQETMAIQLGTDPESRKALLAGTLLPQEGALQVATGLGGLAASALDPDGSTAGFDGHDFMESVNWLFGQASPAVRVPIELASGKEIFSKRDIGVREGEGDITLQDYLLNQVRPIKEYGLGLRRGEIGEAADEQGTGAGVARAFLGGRVQRGLQESRRTTSIYFEYKEKDDALRKAIRLAEKRGDDERVVKLKVQMLEEAKIYLERGGSADELPKWMREDLAGLGVINTE